MIICYKLYKSVEINIQNESISIIGLLMCLKVSFAPIGNGLYHGIRSCFIFDNIMANYSTLRLAHSNFSEIYEECHNLLSFVP